MANPQLEDGRTEISNELSEAFARLYLSASESRVLWAILRKTYGWHKKFDRISYTQFEKLTGMNRRHIADAINRLIERKIVTRRGNNYRLEYGIQKDYDQWELLPIEAINRLRNLKSLPVEATKEIVTRRGNTPLPVEATKSLPVEANTKAKSIYTKAKKTAVSFEEYKKQLRERFSELDFDIELEKFNHYWSEGTRKLERPKLALLNWMLKARKIKAQEASHGTHKQSGRKLPERHSYTQPEDY